MATNVIMSYRILDAAGHTKSFPIYGTFDEATATLSDVLVSVQSRGEFADAILAGQITEMSIEIKVAIPGDFKTEPVADSNVEKVGAISFRRTTPPSKSYTIAMPAISPTVLSLDNIDVSLPAVLAFTDSILDTGETVVAKDDLWSTTMAGVKSGKVTFWG